MRKLSFILILAFGVACDDSNDAMDFSTEGTGSSLARFTITDDFLYIVNNTTLLSINLLNPEKPEVSNHVEIGWGIETIYPFYDNLLIGSANAMYIYSIAEDPSAPELVSVFQHWTSCDPVIAKGDYAYVTLREGTGCMGPFPINELQIVNISSPENPFQVSTLTMNHPHGLGIFESRLFVCEGSHGLTEVDVSDPTNPHVIRTYPEFYAYDLIIRDNLLILTGEDGYFQFNITEDGLQQVSKIEFL